MAEAELRPFADRDLGWAHALNQANGEALSFMERAPFEALVRRASYARVVAPNDAFILAYDAPPMTDSPNFSWFAKRYRNFLYIDRVAVADHARRRGLAGCIYRDLFRFAAEQGYPIIGAEVNADPPNPASDAFHAAQGFQVVGEARLTDRNKTVRYFTRLV